MTDSGISLVNFHTQKIIDAKTGEIFATELLLRRIGSLSLQDFLQTPQLFVAYLPQIIEAKSIAIKSLVLQNMTRFCLLNFTPDQVVSPSFLFHLDLLRSSAEGKLSLAIELTEDADEDIWLKSHDILNEAQQMGFTLVVDDFGKGRSNFASTMSIGASIVKLDMSIIAASVKSLNMKRKLFALVRFFEETNTLVVVEGVETAEMYDVAIESEAHYIQGYYVEKPTPIKCKKPVGIVGQMPLLQSNLELVR